MNVSRGLCTSLVRYSFLTVFLFGPTIEATAQIAGTFIPTGKMNSSRTYHTATLLLNGKVLITGGWRPNETLASAELFDPGTGTFTATGNMTTARSLHSATLLPNGRVLIAGGSANGNPPQPSASAEIYDPSTGAFTPASNLVANLPFNESTQLNDGRALISLWCSDYLDVVPQLYDPNTGTFITSGGGPQKAALYGLCGPPAVLPDGEVLIGSKLYDPITDTFTDTGPRTTIGWYYTSATLLTNGKVLVVGGEGDGGFSPNGEVYDPSTRTFTVTTNSVRSRSAHTATLLRDGKVLLAGGRVSPGSAEIYDAAAGTYASTGDMASPRAYHTATLLLDGRVLMVGGTTSDFPDAELYVPSVLIPAQTVTDLRFDRMSVATGASFSANIAGSNLTTDTFFDVRFTGPGSSASAVVLNWQKGIVESHDVPTGLAAGKWTINGVRAHQTETDHTGIFFPVSATITVSP
jgi:hypothetical protein